MTIHPTPHSAFTHAVEYEPAINLTAAVVQKLTGKRYPPRGVLTLHLRSGRRLVYGEQFGVPYWLVGLLLSASTGMAYNRLVKAQYADDYRSEDGPAPSPDYDTDPDRLTADLRASLEVKA